VSDAPPPKRQLIILIIVLALLSCGTCVGGACWGLNRVVRTVSGSPDWSDDAVTPAEAHDIFGVALPATVLTWRSRTFGLQVWSFEVLAQLRPEDKAWFLATNRLKPARGPPAGLREDLALEIRKAGAPKGQARVTRFALPEQGDGGTLERSAALIEYDDQLWLSLDSFDVERG